MTLIVGVLLVSACSTRTSEAPPASAKLPPPPAVSGIDATVSVTYALADTFDVLPDGRCAGRPPFEKMSDATSVLLRGNSTGWDVESRATARVKHWQPDASRRMPLGPDDYVYCFVEIVFAPSMHDLDGYSVKFAGSPYWDRLSGYSPPFFMSKTACPSLLDPPEKHC